MTGLCGLGAANVGAGIHQLTERLIEIIEHGDPIFFTIGDVIQFGFNIFREIIIHHLKEVLDQEISHYFPGVRRQ